MAYKLLDAAQVRWRCVNAPHQVASHEMLQVWLLQIYDVLKAGP
jgi:hypothetical protein